MDMGEEWVGTNATNSEKEAIQHQVKAIATVSKKDTQGTSMGIRKSKSAKISTAKFVHHRRRT